MKLKENTEKSSDQMRGIASLVLALGIALAILLLILGIGSIMRGSLSSNYYRRSLLESLIHPQGFVYIVMSVLILFYHYIIYVILSAIATLIENSDRTDVVDALKNINETLKQKQECDVEKTNPSEKVIKRAVDAVAKKQEAYDNVEADETGDSEIDND
ncbi:MAG: hypothetical protein K6D38_09300 [Pseudobutyrivibrio sp.]|nr:hypothetical protein [Pseudobutyrivibrio sp.]